MRRHSSTAGRAAATLAAAALLASAAANADIYKFVDEHGRVHLTDRPGHGGYKLLVKTWKGWEPSSGRIDYASVQRNRRRFTPLIDEVASRYRLPDALLHAVIRAESAYDPRAVSSKGAVGLMQLMPGTARRYGVSNRRDPAANIRGGTRYLRDLLALFDNDVVLALAAYNAGEQAVIEHGHRVPPFRETRTYVRRVLEYYRELRAVAASSG